MNGKNVKKLSRAAAKREIDALVGKGMPVVEARAVVMARTDTYTIMGGGSVIWGVDDISTLGTVTNVSISKTGENELLLNQQGAVDGVVFYDEKTEVKMTVIASSTAVLPSTGVKLVIGDVTGVVMICSESKENKGLVKFDVTVNTWTNLTLAA